MFQIPDLLREDARSNVCGTQHMADALITTGPRSSGWPPSSRLQYLRRFLVPRAQLYRLTVLQPGEKMYRSGLHVPNVG